MVRRATGPFAAEYRLLSAGIFALIVGIAFEFMAVATALPVAARELNGLGLYPWALTGFLGAAMFANGVAGELCDRIGPRLPLIAGAASFAVGLLVSGLSTSMEMLIGGRVVQGLGAGFVIVAVYVVIGGCYPDTHRPRVMSLLATAWVVPSVIGPFIAGGLTEFVSWRWAFLSLIPLLPLPLIAVLPRVKAAAGSHVRRSGRMQLAAAMAVGAALLQWAGLEAEGARWLTAAAAALIGVALVVTAVRRLFPAGTLRLRRGLPSVIAFRGVIAGGFFSCEAYVPLMLVEHRGATPTMAGLAVAATALGWSTGSWWQGRPGLKTRRTGLVRLGAAVTTVGVVVTGSSVVVTDAVIVPGWLAGVGLLVAGVGMGLSMSSNAVLLFEFSPEEDRGANSAAIQMSDSLGALVVIGGSGVVYAIWRETLPGTTLFGLVFGVSFLVMLAATFVAFRVRPTGVRPTERRGSSPRAAGRID
ncbi:MAG: MFS transporter [Nocardioidaceae bacterium]|nr:MFS transporter [Nocardioidaceae bacterium]